MRGRKQVYECSPTNMARVRVTASCIGAIGCGARQDQGLTRGIRYLLCREKDEAECRAKKTTIV